MSTLNFSHFTSEGGLTNIVLGDLFIISKEKLFIKKTRRSVFFGGR